MKNLKNLILSFCLVSIQVITGTTISGYFFKEVYASDKKQEEKSERRLDLYPSLSKYLEINKEKQKILVIGGGLTYDDLVIEELCPKVVYEASSGDSVLFIQLSDSIFEIDTSDYLSNPVATS